MNKIKFMNYPSLIILDRDGVINEDSDNYIKSADEWIPIKGSIEAISKLSQKNIPIAIATNQSGLGRNYFNSMTLFDMHQKMLQLIKNQNGEIQYIAYCPHLPNNHCNCRKPKPGLINEISQKLNIKLDKHVYFIGDSFKDIEVAQNSNITPILVKTGKGEKTLEKNPQIKGKIAIYDNLNQFVEYLLKEVIN